MWAEQIASLANPDATDEVNRSAKEHYFLQLLLAYHGYLPADAKIDGSYGAGTRAAIMTVQKEAQLPETGFMSTATADYLRKRSDQK